MSSIIHLYTGMREMEDIDKYRMAIGELDFETEDKEETYWFDYGLMTDNVGIWIKADDCYSWYIEKKSLLESDGTINNEDAFFIGTIVDIDNEGLEETYISRDFDIVWNRLKPHIWDHLPDE